MLPFFVFYKGLVKLRTKGEDVDLITSQICNLLSSTYKCNFLGADNKQ